MYNLIQANGHITVTDTTQYLQRENSWAVHKRNNMIEKSKYNGGTTELDQCTQCCQILVSHAVSRSLINFVLKWLVTDLSGVQSTGLDKNRFYCIWPNN